ncbi:hypothetical protein EXIGLDRAFT_847812 [Exidia glandulosa HHB12029]|uniref:DUF6535 domain-containing protein n=1 Tax=Exidia glandulosa HHB12029 TaxID=1314781 RepID=A0A166MJ91_EXIGL|nr:hypothetical protein EXIGLDRAFT_847812 [Exidia glandulosa HHB12029]
MDYDQGRTDTAVADVPPVKEDSKLPPEELDTEFKKEFPPDPKIGGEMDDAARVWKVYRKEAMAFDSALLEGWSSTLDILLIFAGLFSAVATAFVIESYQFLQPDNAAYTATALYILVAASNHSTGITLPPPPDLSFGSSLARWINGLLFTSILLSLAVALLSILVKQWITEYRARNNASSKSPRDWARRREVYSHSLEAWPVAEVVSFLPVLLHLSLFLFVAGVVAFLWGLDQGIGIWIIMLGSCLAIFYAGCTLVPLWIPQCPTATPLTRQVRRAALSILVFVLRAFSRGYRALPRPISLVGKRITIRRCTNGRTRLHPSSSELLLPIATAPPPAKPLSLSVRVERAVERIDALRQDRSGIDRYLERNRDDLDASTLTWLITEVSDSDAVAVGIQALGAIHPTSPLADLLRRHDALVDFGLDTARTRSAGDTSATELIRVGRSMLSMTRPGDEVAYWRLRPIYDIAHDNPHLAILSIYRFWITPALILNSDERFRTRSVTSTAIRALRAQRRNLPQSLTLLLNCDLGQISAGDWDIVIDAVYSLDEIASHYSLIRSRKISSPLRLADLVSQVAIRSHDPYMTGLAHRFVACIISTNYRRWLPGLYFSVLPVLEVPFLVEVLGSRQFLGLCKASDLQPIAWLLNATVVDLFTKGRPGAATRNIMFMLWRAGGNVVEAALALGPTNEFFWHILDLYTKGLRWCWISHGYTVDLDDDRTNGTVFKNAIIWVTAVPCRAPWYHSVDMCSTQL